MEWDGDTGRGGVLSNIYIYIYIYVHIVKKGGVVFAVVGVL